MGELNSATAPRDLSRHYKETRTRLWTNPQRAIPIDVPTRHDPDPAIMRELAKLREETKAFRDFLTERGIDCASVINRKPSLSTV